MEGIHLSGQVKILPGECVFRVTCPNGECCQNLVSNTVLQSLVIFKCYHFVLISMEYINATSLVVETLPLSNLLLRLLPLVSFDKNNRELCISILASC